MSSTATLPYANIFRNLGMEPDPWQLEVLEGQHRRLLLNCARQAGKSTVAAVLGLVEAVVRPGAVVLFLSRSQRQSAELFRIVARAVRVLRAPHIRRLTSHELELASGSRIVSLPCSADTIRGFAGVRLLVIDEAARVPDELYRTVRPMLAATDGRLALLSTPNGKRGFFWQAWAKGDEWHRVEIAARACPRITAEFLEEERRNLGPTWFRQEYECSFEAMEGLVYPDFQRCLVERSDPAYWLHCPESELPPPPKRMCPVERTQRMLMGLVTPPDPPPPPRRPVHDNLVGGIDFGFRNPFAAVWGHVDRDDVIWLTGEHYAAQQPLSYHARHLPRKVMWYADPAGAGDMSELRAGGFYVRKGNNALRLGIMAVTSRLQAGTLKVLAGACPNLLREAGLYRWGSEGGEAPEDAHNHALAALRYMVARLDARKLALAGREAVA